MDYFKHIQYEKDRDYQVYYSQVIDQLRYTHFIHQSICPSFSFHYYWFYVKPLGPISYDMDTDTD